MASNQNGDILNKLQPVFVMMKKILQPNAKLSRIEFMEAYNLVYTILGKYGWQSPDRIVKPILEEMKKLMINHLFGQTSAHLDLNETAFLKFFNELLINFNFLNKVLNGIFMSVSKTFTFPINQTTAEVWRENLITFNKKVTGSILKLIEMYRNGHYSDLKLISSIIKTYEVAAIAQIPTESKIYHSNIYRLLFELDFLVESEKFFKNEYTLIQTLPMSGYVKRVKQRLDDEAKLLKVCLYDSTNVKLIGIASDSLIKPHLYAFRTAFQNEELATLHTFVVLINENQTFADIFHEHMKKESLAKIAQCDTNAPDGEDFYIESILKFYKKYHELVYKTFKGESKFVAAFGNVFSRIVNRNASINNIKNNISVILVKQIDKLIRESNKSTIYHDIEQVLFALIAVFQYIDDKDFFQLNYRKALANRLITQKMETNDTKEFMITKIREICGIQYTSQWRRMYQDVQISKDLNVKHREFVRTKLVDEPKIEFEAQVLTSAVWPFKVENPVMLPWNLQDSIMIFNKFYSSVYSGRVLKWLYSRSEGELIMNCTKNRYTITANSIQIAVLLQFNLNSELTVQEIGQSTKIEYDELVRILNFLLKLKLLKCQTEHVLTKESVIEWFQDYKNKKLRFNINVPLPKPEQQKNQEADVKTIEVDRRNCIHAAIVRIMKMRKTMQHQDLVGEILSQLSSQFKPKVVMIKKCIDECIAKEYIERDSHKNEIYNYIA